MATNSRRLAISSLLCNESPADNVQSQFSQNTFLAFSETPQTSSFRSACIPDELPAFHSQGANLTLFSPSRQHALTFHSSDTPSSFSPRSSKKSSVHAIRINSYETTSLSTSPTSAMPLSGLEALVHVATEERQRIYTNDFHLATDNQDSSVRTVQYQSSPSSISERRQYRYISPQPYIQPLPLASMSQPTVVKSCQSHHAEKGFHPKKRQRSTPNVDLEIGGTTAITLSTEHTNITSSPLPLRDSQISASNVQISAQSPLAPTSSLQFSLSVSNNKSMDMLDRKNPQSTVSSSEFAVQYATSFIRPDERQEDRVSKVGHRIIEKPYFWRDNSTGGNVDNEYQFSAAKESEEAEEDVHDFFLSTVTSTDANSVQTLKAVQSIASERKTNDFLKEAKLVEYEKSRSARFVTSPWVADGSSNVVRCAVSETELCSNVPPISIEQGRSKPELPLERLNPRLIEKIIDIEDEILAGISEVSDELSHDMDVDVDDELLKLLDDTPDHLQHDSQWLSESNVAHAHDMPDKFLNSRRGKTDRSRIQYEREHGSVPTQRTEIDMDDLLKRDVNVSPKHISNPFSKSSTTSKDAPKRSSKSQSKRSRGDSKRIRKNKCVHRDERSEESQPFYKTNGLTFAIFRPAKGEGNNESFPNITSSGRTVTKSRKSVAADAGRGPNIQLSVSATTMSSIESSSPSSVAQNKMRLSATKKTVARVDLSRSRSHSVLYQNTTRSDIPNNDVAKVDEAEAAIEEGKLYCICQTTYDEDRVMIACDRCDEWYHTQCVNMADLDIDLVDQFICSICIQQNPYLHLQTTYKRRCLAGLMNFDPNSPGACHKPARGAFSKYCSDECGVMYMQTKIQIWIDTDGDINHLWACLRGTKKREGVVIAEPLNCSAVQNQKDSSDVLRNLKNIDNQPLEMFCIESIATDPREVFDLRNLQTQLNRILHDREARNHEKGIILRRQELLQMAIQRVASLEDECGWDQRLCFGDEEWEEFGEGVIESYDDSLLGKSEAKKFENIDIDEGEWWCRGKKRCDRHSGWQKLKFAEIDFDRDLKENAISSLTRLEREIRKSIEDIFQRSLTTGNVGLKNVQKK